MSRIWPRKLTNNDFFRLLNILALNLNDAQHDSTHSNLLSTIFNEIPSIGEIYHTGLLVKTFSNKTQLKNLFCFLPNDWIF